MKLYDSLICYAVLRELGSEFDGFAESLRMFAISDFLPTRFAKQGEQGETLPLYDADTGERIRLNGEMLSPADQPEDPDATRIIVADRLWEVGEDKIADWLRRLAEWPQRHRRTQSWDSRWISLRSNASPGYWKPNFWVPQLKVDYSIMTLGRCAIDFINQGSWPHITKYSFTLWARHGAKLHDQTPMPLFRYRQ